MKLYFKFLLVTLVLVLRTSNAMKILQSGDTYYVSVCSPPTSPYENSCNAQVVTDSTGSIIQTLHILNRDSTFRTQANKCDPMINKGFGPADLQSAYGITLPERVSAGTGPIVAVVIAGDYATFETDLAIYRSAYCLPACTVSSGCLSKVNQNGVNNSFPASLKGWDVEGAIGLQMISAICPSCKLLLVVANTPLISDMGTGVNTAVALGKLADRQM